jgi:outer membrane protein assembly factor BamB
MEEYDASRTELLPAGDDLIELVVELKQANLVQIQAMKAPPAKSALEGTVNAAATVDIANEIFNEMQRDRTGGIRVEDESRYSVTLKSLLAKDAQWTGEVVGPPFFFPLKTAGVLIAGKTVQVFNRAQKKLWEANLNYSISPQASLGAGLAVRGLVENVVPCVERANTLYLFDQGVLTAFDLATGAVRWRLPSVGISSLLFDEAGAMYVNTTSARPESIQYSQQIDISQHTRAVILKVDAQTGKVLWRTENRGKLTYAEGKFLYAVESQMGGGGGFLQRSAPAHARIYRLKAGSGKTQWEYLRKGFPRETVFDHNQIVLLMDKEIQVVNFLAW